MNAPTLPEHLAKQFYAWELWGRGWQEFPGAVALEPPFQPFPGYFLPQAKDDGHRPTYLSRLLSPPRREVEVPEVEEPEPSPFEACEPLRESILTLPPDKVGGAETSERFLLALSGAELPLAYEIVGLAETLHVRLVSRRPDAALLANELRAFFPEVSIQEDPEGLRAAWASGEGETPTRPSAW